MARRRALRPSSVLALVVLLVFSATVGCGDGPSRQQAQSPAASAAVPASPPVSAPEREPRVVAVLFPDRSARVDVEVVDTPETLQRGLMFREELAESAGMLFVFPAPRRLAFWMKNTPLPLSIAFIDDGMRVDAVEDMRPLDEGPRYRSRGACRFALEVNQGWFAAHGVRVGDRAVFLSETAP